jgi:hypothetical protein
MPCYSNESSPKNRNFLYTNSIEVCFASRFAVCRTIPYFFPLTYLGDAHPLATQSHTVTVVGLSAATKLLTSSTIVQRKIAPHGTTIRKRTTQIVNLLQPHHSLGHHWNLRLGCDYKAIECLEVASVLRSHTIVNDHGAGITTCHRRGLL